MGEVFSVKSFRTVEKCHLLLHYVWDMGLVVGVCHHLIIDMGCTQSCAARMRWPGWMVVRLCLQLTLG